jgi:hypothetical protein
MSSPEATLGMCGNIYTRQMHFINAGDTEYGHTNPYDHMTLLAKGALKVIVDGVETEFKAPHIIWINSEKRHELVALENDTVAYCIHAIRESGEILDPDMIPNGQGKRLDLSKIDLSEIVNL